MSTWIAAVRYTGHAGLLVEAGSYGEAQDRAQAAGEAQAPPGCTTSVSILRMDGEPWLQLAYVCRGAHPTTIVCLRATGHRFTQADVDLLKTRVVAGGLTLREVWNGVGGSSLSIGCTEPIDWEDKRSEAISTPLLAALCAPRPPEVEAVEQSTLENEAWAQNMGRP